MSRTARRRLVIRNKKFGDVRREVPVVKGNNGEGMFELYKDGEKYIFRIEYFNHSLNNSLIYRELNNEAEAIGCIEKFMSRG